MRACSQGSAGAERLSSLQVFANNSSLHGISHIFRHGSLSLRRVLWALFFLGSLGLLLLVCMERVNYFFTYPHVTKLDEVAAPNLTFPAITICNLNEFRFSRITRNDLYHVGQLLALLSDRYEIRSPHLAEPQLLAALRDKANFRNFKAKPFDMADFYNRTGECHPDPAPCIHSHALALAPALAPYPESPPTPKLPPRVSTLHPILCPNTQPHTPSCAQTPSPLG
uniref:Uncharacterized protein n=1 Tax=Chelonoidis abingdonii TaxID=106734 RepID=A0A8C0GQ92_CHEAB